MTCKEATELARSFTPAQYELDRFAEFDDEFWFSYCLPDGEVVVGASLVVVNKETREVRTMSFTEDFPRVLKTWNSTETMKVSEGCR